MYVQQRDEYLESVCEMAIRKVSIITIFGSLANSTMKIDHYQIGKEACKQRGLKKAAAAEPTLNSCGDLNSH